MQTRVQLIDAKDSRGIKLGKIESFKLLELALKAQGSQFEFIVMPPMTEEETKKILVNLKHSTTLAYGKTSHKVTRQHLRNNTLVDASDIAVPEDSKYSPIAKGLKILTRMFRKQQKIVINELYNNMAWLNLESNERKLKIQLFLSKLNSVVTKKIDMVKYSCFNEIKLSSLQNRSINRSGKEYEHWFSNSSRGYNKERIERKGTDSELRRTRSTNRHGYGYSSPSHTNASNSMNPIREAMAKNGICKYPLTSSLIGNTLLRQHLGMTKKIKEKEEELSDSMLISDSLKDNDYELSSDSDIETKELDDYINRRLAKIEETKAKKEKSKLSKKENSKQPKSKEKIVIFDDSEYEYILESEEDEEEYSSSEDNTQLDQIFSKSFLAENMRASDALLIAKNSLVAPNEVSRLSSNLQRSKLGPMRSTVTRKSEIKNNGSILQVEERKEDSYIHPAFENSVAFSNISGIFGHQTLNNHGLMSLRDDSFANEYEDLEFESNLEKELNWNSEKKSKHARIPSVVDTVSEDEYGNTHKDSHIVYLKNDMEKITKDLERIRDLVMNNPNAKQAFDWIFEESQSKSKIESKTLLSLIVIENCLWIFLIYLSLLFY